MKKNYSVFFKSVAAAVTLFCSSIAVAQQVPCGTTELMNKLYTDHPEYKTDADNLENQLRQLIEEAQSQRAAGTPYTIPCVVHIIHTGQALGATSASLNGSIPNPTDAQIRAAFDAVNADYNKRNNKPRYSGNDSTGIKVCLATKDPNGVAMPAGAINRFNGALSTTWTAVGLPASNATTYSASGVYSSSIGIPEADLSTLIKWPINKYYNIYIVTEIDGNNGGSGVQGFAYYPPGSLSSPDRAIMLPSSFTASSISTFDHEMGHALNLSHTFRGAGGTEDPQGTGACPTESSCSTDGDFICDIPLCKSMLSVACKADNTSNPCQAGTTFGQFQYNYMGYGGCPNGFSPGQTTRMRATLAANAIRINQVSPSNLTACGCDGTNPPYADFNASTVTPCVGVGDQFTDASSYAPTSWTWSFSPSTVTFLGGTTANSQNPIVSFNASGTYNVTLLATNSYGSNTTTKTAYITTVTGASVPFVEGFESATFPPTGWTRTGDDVADGSGWDVDPGTKQWERRTTAGNGTSTASAAMNLYAYGYNSDSRDNLISKPVSLSGVVSPILTFKVAHKNYGSAANSDTLTVYLSSDCGNTYVPSGYKKWGSTLATNGSSTASFSPTVAADWRTETINLSAYAGSNIIVKFETRNRYGNNVYIDDINIFDAPAASVIITQTAGTNPMCAGASATFTATPTNGGTAPSYQWKVNGLNAGTNSATFTTTSLTNGQVVTCVMTSNLAGVAGSPATSNSITMVVNANPATPVASSNTPVCAGSTINLSTSTVAGVTYSWTGPSSFTASVQSPTRSSATAAMAGTYSVNITNSNGCTSANGTTTVVITTPPVATFSYTGTPYCKTASNPSPTFSGGGVAGTFSSTAGLVFVSTSTGQVNLSASTAGTYTVTNTIAASGGCGAVTATATITITAPPVATFSYTGTPYCKTAANPLPTFSGGGVAGTFSAGAGVVFVSTSTGEIDLAASTSGTYTITNTIPASNGCGAITATATITIKTPPVATFSYTGTPYCKTAANPSPTYSGGGVAGTFSSTAGLVFVSTSTGQVNLSASTAGTYTVTNTIAASGGCGAVTATATITITAPPVATFSYTGTPYCKTASNPSPTFSGSGVAGTFSSTAGLVFVSTSTGQVDLAASTAGTYTVTNTIAASGGCGAVTATASITITTPSTATFSYTGTPYCKTASNPSPTFSGGGVAGTFSSTAGLVFVSTSTGQVNLSASTAGTYTVTNTIAASGGCGAVTATATITITASPVATFSYAGTPYCETASNPSPAYSGGGVAGTFSSTAGLVFVSTSTGQVDIAASTTGTYTVTNTIAASGGCGAITATAPVTINSNVTPGITIAQTTGSSPMCAGATATFTATPANGGTSPVYQWQINGSPVGTNTATYTTTSLADGDIVTCLLTSNAQCASPATASSNAIAMTVNPVLTPSVSVSIASGSNPMCSGQMVTFLASIVNGGSAPGYQWQVNGSNVGSNLATYTSGLLADGEIVTCTLTSNAVCASSTTVTSSGITMSVNPNVTPALNISVTPSDVICEGDMATFTASATNGGASPAYQWKVNNIDAGTNSASFGSAALSNGDLISCVLTSSASCVTSSTANSNSVAMTVNPVPATPTITLAGSTLTSSAASGNQWYLDGNPISGATAQNYTFTVNGDYTVVVTAAGCSSASSAVTSITSVGISDHVSQFDLSVYPNPNDGNFTLSFFAVEKSDYRLEISNAIGQLVFKDKLDSFSGSYSKQLSVVKYGKGVYTISLINSKNETVKKMIVY